MSDIAVLKYEITDIPHPDDPTLHRIRALRDIPRYVVKRGDIGGFVLSDCNLAPDGDCWIAGNAIVTDNARVLGHAIVQDMAHVSGNSVVAGNAIVAGRATVSGRSTVKDYAGVTGCSKIVDSYIGDNAVVGGFAHVSGCSGVSGAVHIEGDAIVRNNACVYSDALIEGSAVIEGSVAGRNVCINGKVRIGHDAFINGSAINFRGDAVINSNKDWYDLRNVWSSFRNFVYTRSNKRWQCGCFCGSSEELIKAAYEKSKRTGDCYKAAVEYVERIYALIEENGE